MNKVTFVSTAHPYRGGIASFNEMLARELIKNGDNVDIITFTVQYPSFLFPGKTQYTDNPAPKDLKITRMVNSVNPLSWIKVGLKLFKSKPDILFLRYWSPYLAPALATIAYIARANKHTKVVTLADNITAHETHFYDKILTSYFVGCTDKFIVMSSEVKDDLRKFTSSKPVVFHPHPIYENYGTPISKQEACQNLNLDPNNEYALFFGFIRDYKGLDLLLDAWAAFIATGNGAKNHMLLVAGEYYNDKTQYEKQIDRLGIGSKVKLIDKYIPDQEVKDYFCAATTVVQPYKSATQSGVTQIAYNFNIPMIVTNVGGLPEIVANNKVGYTVNPNAEEITKAIIKMFSGTNASDMLRNFKAEKERFSWKSFAKNVTRE
ncbi:MAG: glycosyltransferase [Rikenellaceae bacterium]